MDLYVVVKRDSMWGELVSVVGLYDSKQKARDLIDTLSSPRQHEYEYDIILCKLNSEVI